MIKKNTFFSLLLYALAVALIIYTIWAVIGCHSYINSLIAQNQLSTSSNGFDIASYYMANCFQYSLFAILFFFMGWVVQNFSHRSEQGKSGESKMSESKSHSTIFPEEDNDDDLDEWLKNRDK